MERITAAFVRIASEIDQATRQAELRFSDEEIDLTRESFRVRFVVRIHPGDEIAAGEGDAGVQCGDNSAVCLGMQSNARIATLMRNLDASPWLTNAELVETKAVQLNTLRVNEFSLNIRLKREKQADGAKPVAKEKGA